MGKPAIVSDWTKNASYTQEYECMEAGFSKPIQRFLGTGSSLMSSYPGNSYWVLLKPAGNKQGPIHSLLRL